MTGLTANETATIQGTTQIVALSLQAVATETGSSETIYSDIADPEDIILGWATKDAQGLATLELNGNSFGDLSSTNYVKLDNGYIKSSEGFVIDGSAAAEKLQLLNTGKMVVGNDSEGGVQFEKTGITIVGYDGAVDPGTSDVFAQRRAGKLRIGGLRAYSPALEFWHFNSGQDATSSNFIGATEAAQTTLNQTYRTSYIEGYREGSQSIPSGGTTDANDLRIFLQSDTGSDPDPMPRQIEMGLGRPYLDGGTLTWSEFHSLAPVTASVLDTTSGSDPDATLAQGDGWLGNTSGSWSGLYLRTQSRPTTSSTAYADINSDVNNATVTTSLAPAAVNTNASDGVLYLQRVDIDEDNNDADDMMGVRVRYKLGSTLKTHSLIGVTNDIGDVGESLQPDGKGTYAWDPSITLRDKLVAYGDTDTYLDFATDQIQLVTGNLMGIRIDETSSAVNVGIAGDHNSSYGLYLTGDASKSVGGTTWDDHSDDRIKTDVASITSATDKLKTLNPVSFKYTDAWQQATKNRDITHYGFLASDFESTFPDFTRTTTTDMARLSNGTYIFGEFSPKVAGADALPEGATLVTENIKNINVSSIIPYLVATIKELEARIAALEGA